MAPDTSPAFQFYPKDFLSSSKVARMSLTEIGIYTVLLCHAWLDDGLPTKTTEIAKLLKMQHARFLRIWSGVLCTCFVEENGRLVNVRLEGEREKQAVYRSKQTENGSRGGRPKKTQAFSPENPRGEADGESSLVLLEEKKREADFGTFWQVYPRKDAKQKALESWLKIAPDNNTQRAISADIERRCRSSQWLKDGGQFIPMAATYLNQKRWEDGFVERPRLSERTVNVIKGFEDVSEDIA